MPDVNLVRINRVPFSWTSCAFFMAGFPYKGVTSVAYKESREVKLVHAGQQDGTPLGITSGLYKVESMSISMLRDSAVGLMADLTVLGLGSYGDAEWPFYMQLFEPSIPPSLPQSVLITGCRIIGVEEKQEVGVDELVTEFTIQPMLLIRTVAGVPLKLWSTTRTLLP